MAITVHDNSYMKVSQTLSHIKNILEEQIDESSDEFKYFYGAFINNFSTMYDWRDKDFTLLNSEDYDIEDMLSDLKKYKCETFGEFAILYMSMYIDELQKFVEVNTKEE